MKKRHSAEQVVAKLRQADVALGKGLKVPQAGPPAVEGRAPSGAAEAAETASFARQ